MLKNNKKRFLFCLCVTAVFSALGIVLEGYLKIPFPFLEISLAFVPILFCGMLTGPLWGAACAFLVDFIATALAGQGAYFIGFAPIVMATGALFGLMGSASKACLSDKRYYVFSLALVTVNAVLCEGVFKSYMICVFQVFVARSQPDMVWPLFFSWFVIRIVYAVVQGAAVFTLGILVRKQIYPRLRKVVSKIDG